MSESRQVLRHLLAALAYRTQKALREAPADFGEFRAGDEVRTPTELIRHMGTVLWYAHSLFSQGAPRPEPLPTLAEEVERFHRVLEDVARHLDAGTPISSGITELQLLQGPFADALTHAGQLALLRRLAGSPISAESFVDADISVDRLGRENGAGR